MTMQHIIFRQFGKSKFVGVFIFLITQSITANTQGISINDSIATFYNSDNPGEAIDHIDLASLNFFKSANKSVNFGFKGNDYHYILMKVNSGDTLKDQYLSINNTSLDSVSIYRIYPGHKAKLLYMGGDRVAFKSTALYVWHTAPLTITRDPSYYLIAMKAPQENINVFYEIIHRDDLQMQYASYERLVFFYIGIIAMIASIITLAFFLFKKGAFAAYLGYIICFSGWVVSHYGRIFPFIYPDIPVINGIAKAVSSLGAGFFLLMVLYLVFSYNLQKNRWLQKLIKIQLGILLILILFMVLLLFPGIPAQVKTVLIITWHIGLIFTILLIMITPLYFINSGATAKIFSSAMLVICIVSIIQLFANLGFITNFFINEHGMTMASLLEIAIMAFGLFYSLLEEKKRKENQVLALEQEQTETLKKLISVQDDERKRIGSDLHDNIGPLLAALKINFRRIIQTIEGEFREDLVVKTEAIIDDSIAEIRNVAHNLMPKSLSSKGLINTLNDYFSGLQQLYDKTISFHHQIESIFHPDLQINIYRIICELVLNACKHSKANLITVRIITNEKVVLVSVFDDGHWFQLKPGDEKNTLGLQNVESRVSYLKGKFSLKTRPGSGTTINLEIPLQF